MFIHSERARVCSVCVCVSVRAACNIIAFFKFIFISILHLLGVYCYDNDDNNNYNINTLCTTVLHAIKRAANRETWYVNSVSPQCRTRTDDCRRGLAAQQQCRRVDTPRPVCASVQCTSVRLTNGYCLINGLTLAAAARRRNIVGGCLRIIIIVINYVIGRFDRRYRATMRFEKYKQ